MGVRGVRGGQGGLGGQGAASPEKYFYFQVENMIGEQYRDKSSLKFRMLPHVGPFVAAAAG